MSYCVGRKHGSDPTLLWLWCRPAIIALIQPLAWEPPCAMGVALKKKRVKEKINVLSSNVQKTKVLKGTTRNHSKDWPVCGQEFLCWVQVLVYFLSFPYFSRYFHRENNIHFLFVCFLLLGLHLRHMDVPGLGVEPEPQQHGIQATSNDLHQSPQKHSILNPLSESKDRTCILMDPSWLHFPWATKGTPRYTHFEYSTYNLQEVRQDVWGHVPHCWSFGRASVSHWGPSKGLPEASQSHDRSLQTSRQTGRGKWWWCRELERWDPQQPESSQYPLGFTSKISLSCSMINKLVLCVFLILSSLTNPTPGTHSAPTHSLISEWALSFPHFWAEF